MRSTIVVLLTMVAVSLARSDKLHPAQGESKYSDTTYHFELLPPNFGEADGGVVPVTFSAPAANGFAANVNVLIQVKQPDREKYVSDTKHQIELMHGRIIDTKDLRVSGHDAVQTEYSMTIRNKDLHFLSLAIFVESKVYLITCTDTQSQFENRRSQFLKCLQSFKIYPQSGGR